MVVVLTKMVSLLLSVVMVFTLGTTVYANSDTINFTSEAIENNQSVLAQKQKINKVMKELSAYRTKKLLKSSSLINLQSSAYVDITEISLENQLKSLGVTVPTEETLKSLGVSADNSGIITPNVAVPGSNSKVKWYDYNYSWFGSDGTKYSLQQLYAQGLGVGTNLAVAEDSRSLYTNQQVIVSNLTNIGSMYVQKAIGLIPLVSWLPYELLFTNTQGAVNNSHKITYRSLNTVCFAYVKPYGASDNAQVLSFISNYIDIASTHILAGFQDGVSYSKSNDFYNYAYATSYTSEDEAIAGYKSAYPPKTSFVSGFTFYNHDQSKYIKQSVLTPSFPAHISY